MEAVVGVLAFALVCVSLAMVWLCSRFLRALTDLQLDVAIQRAKRPRVLDDEVFTPSPAQSPVAVDGNGLWERAKPGDIRE